MNFNKYELSRSVSRFTWIACLLQRGPSKRQSWAILVAIRSSSIQSSPPRKSVILSQEFLICRRMLFTLVFQVLICYYPYEPASLEATDCLLTSYSCDYLMHYFFFIQVRKLTSLFQTSAHSQQVQIPLVPLRPIIPAAEAPLLPLPAEILGRGQKEIAPLQKETIPLDILSFGEKEYRMYGLRRPALPAPAPVPSVVSDPPRGNRDPYDPYAPLRRAPYLSEMDGETDILRRRMDESEYERAAPRHSATHRTFHHSYHPSGVPRSEAEYGAREVEAGRLHSTHAANALSDYNRGHQQPRDREDYASLPVSSRYSFAGPSF